MKKGIKGIAEGYGLSDADVHIESQFGEDALPMFCKVEGTSMVPTFQDGEYVMIEKTNNFTVGDCVVANVDGYGRVIKRVSEINGDQVYLTSDNKKVSYEVHGDYIYKTEGLKTWTDRENIVGVVRIHNITDNSKFEIISPFMGVSCFVARGICEWRSGGVARKRLRPWRRTRIFGNLRELWRGAAARNPSRRALGRDNI